MKDQILDILSDIVDDDVESCTTLIDDGVLSSLDIIQLIGALNDEFDISIPATEIIPQNFNSVDAMVAMVERLADEYAGYGERGGRRPQTPPGDAIPRPLLRFARVSINQVVAEGFQRATGKPFGGVWGRAPYFITR